MSISRKKAQNLLGELLSEAMIDIVEDSPKLVQLEQKVDKLIEFLNRDLKQDFREMVELVENLEEKVKDLEVRLNTADSYSQEKKEQQ